MAHDKAENTSPDDSPYRSLPWGELCKRYQAAIRPVRGQLFGREQQDKDKLYDSYMLALDYALECNRRHMHKEDRGNWFTNVLFGNPSHVMDLPEILTYRNKHTGLGQFMAYQDEIHQALFGEAALTNRSLSALSEREILANGTDLLKVRMSKIILDTLEKSQEAPPRTIAAETAASPAPEPQPEPEPARMNHFSVNPEYGFETDETVVALAPLPAGQKVLRLRDYPHLAQLPDGLKLQELMLVNCPSLAALPDDLQLQYGPLSLRDCPLIAHIPPGVTAIEGLDVAGCVALRGLPEGMIIHHWVDLADCPLLETPHLFEGLEIRWRGMVIEPRIAFEPDSITTAEVLAERNTERRRVMMQRMGFERFMEEAKAQELDADIDPSGNARRLLKVEMQGDEPLVCVSVSCPSTDRPYLLRVPPTIRTCHDAVAWTAGFDPAESGKYKILAES